MISVNRSIAKDVLIARWIKRYMLGHDIEKCSVVYVVYMFMPCTYSCAVALTSSHAYKRFLSPMQHSLDYTPIPTSTVCCTWTKRAERNIQQQVLEVIKLIVSFSRKKNIPLQFIFIFDSIHSICIHLRNYRHNWQLEPTQIKLSLFFNYYELFGLKELGMLAACCCRICASLW